MKKVLFGILSAALCFSLAMAIIPGIGKADAGMSTGTDGLRTYTNSLTDADSISADFDSYYIFDNSSYKELEPVASHWRVDSNGVTRVYDYYNANPTQPDGSDGSPDLNRFDTKYICSLVLKNQMFADFELTVSIKKNSGDGTYWPAICFRQEAGGNFFIHTNAGAGYFLQDSGKPTLWGTTIGGPHERESVSGFNVNSFFTIKLRVQGTSIEGFLKKADGSFDKHFTYTSPKGFYGEGFISLQSVNNSCTFKDLTIAELPSVVLPERDVQDPVSDSTADNALDKIKSGDVVLADFNEEKKQENNEDNDSCDAGAGAIGSIIAAAGLFLVIKKRSK